MASVFRFAPSPTSFLLPRSLLPFLPAKPFAIERHRLLRVRPRSDGLRARRRFSGVRLGYSLDDEDEQPSDAEGAGFGWAVQLFNGGEYYRCHDFLEELWYDAEEPIRTLLHGILQCAVGLHHLFNQNHRGAMMELGEGLCKLRKMDFESGPFFQFEEEVSAALEFLYQTQKELAACRFSCLH